MTAVCRLKTLSVYRFKTSPCMPATRAHMSLRETARCSCCFFTPFGGKRCTRHIVVVHVVVVGYFCMTKFFHCWSRFKRLQTTNSSQCLSRSAYHRSRGSTWTNCCVFCSQFWRKVLHSRLFEFLTTLTF